MSSCSMSNLQIQTATVDRAGCVAFTRFGHHVPANMLKSRRRKRASVHQLRPFIVQGATTRSDRFSSAIRGPLGSFGFPVPTGQVRASTAAVLGSLAPHETQLVTFTAQSSGSDGHILPDPYAGGSVIGFRTSPTSQFTNLELHLPARHCFFGSWWTLPTEPRLLRCYGLEPVPRRAALGEPDRVRLGPIRTAQKLAAAVVNAAGTSMTSSDSARVNPFAGIPR